MFCLLFDFIGTVVFVLFNFLALLPVFYIRIYFSTFTFFVLHFLILIITILALFGDVVFPVWFFLSFIFDRPFAACVSLGAAGSRPLFPQWSHHVYPQFLPGGHPAHRHPHTHCKLECGQHVNNNTHAHSRIASYHRAHAGNAAVDDGKRRSHKGAFNILKSNGPIRRPWGSPIK